MASWPILLLLISSPSARVDAGKAINGRRCHRRRQAGEDVGDAPEIGDDDYNAGR